MRQGMEKAAAHHAEAGRFSTWATAKVLPSQRGEDLRMTTSDAPGCKGLRARQGTRDATLFSVASRIIGRGFPQR